MQQRHWMYIAAIFGMLFVGASNASAQAGAVQGRVTDAEGRPIKSATIKASNPNGKPPQITATTDEKGKFSMIGLTGGGWAFVAEAPGFQASQGRMNVRSVSTGNPPLMFALQRSIEPLPNALSRQIAADIAAADDMRSAGRLDQAISAYEELLSKNPTLTMVNLVIGESYRQKAAKENNPAVRQPLYDRAIAAYQQILKVEPENERAKNELTRTQQQKAGGN